MKLKNLGPNQSEVVFKDATIFFSYETPVAAHVPGMGFLRTESKYSATTTRHINKWLDGAQAKECSQETINGFVEST